MYCPEIPAALAGATMTTRASTARNNNARFIVPTSCVEKMWFESCKSGGPIQHVTFSTPEPAQSRGRGRIPAGRRCRPASPHRTGLVPNPKSEYRNSKQTRIKPKAKIRNVQRVLFRISDSLGFVSDFDIRIFGQRPQDTYFLAAAAFAAGFSFAVN